MTRAPLDPILKEAVAEGTPVEIFDPASNKVYYLLSAEQFQQMAGHPTSEFDPRNAYPLVDEIMGQDDAHDPLLESYQ